MLHFVEEKWIAIALEYTLRQLQRALKSLYFKEIRFL